MKQSITIFFALGAMALSGCVTETVTPAPSVRGPSRTTVRGGKGGDGDQVATSVHDRQPTSEPTADARPATDRQPAAPFKSPDPNTVLNSDPCVANLQNLSGAILTYYSVNQALPDQLSAVTKLADVDAPFNLRCPVSHLPYVYERDGLRADGKSKVIIVHDAAASHAGTRWCIIMSAPKSIANRALEVVQMPEATFRLYH